MIHAAQSGIILEYSRGIIGEIVRLWLSTGMRSISKYSKDRGKGKDRGNRNNDSPLATSSDDVIYPLHAPTPPLTTNSPQHHCSLKRKKAIVFATLLSHQGAGTHNDPIIIDDPPTRVDTPNPRKICWFCGDRGHLRRDCPLRMCKTCWKIHDGGYTACPVNDEKEAGWDGSWDVEWDDTAYGNVTGERCD
ncbi:hypothetical protein BJ138DRAFT_1107802 [Hygrophoropsis aurantiaca]|uniref:Uncharacterized protein n=1 Tax=Hygrophoropsis aurantiaca TaxID=72124 RepID=A0ACB7ZQU6_9AGAM|nr:hypothetical protein BJ138DRAFT_1107802 [Hygrophoropsis aurantiaca]